MSDRIEELEHIIRDGFCTGQVHSFHEHHAAVRELATIAREAEKNASGQEANAVFALQLKRDAEAEAEKWRKVAEAGKRMAAAYEPIRCNLDPEDSGCDDPCHQCSLAQAVRAHNEFTAALADLNDTLRKDDD